jgi:pimeloyl-ACP methyl ester carboxylesterase
LTAPGSGLDFSALRMEEPAPLGTYEARDGARLGLRSYAGPDDLQLVLLHGSGSHGAYLAPLARALSETATVHTPDLRGHGSGNSTGVPASRWPATPRVAAWHFVMRGAYEARTSTAWRCWRPS